MKSNSASATKILQFHSNFIRIETAAAAAVRQMRLDNHLLLYYSIFFYTKLDTLQPLFTNRGSLQLINLYKGQAGQLDHLCVVHVFSNLFTEAPIQSLVSN
jgi:hypothetical protein